MDHSRTSSRRLSAALAAFAAAFVLALTCAAPAQASTITADIDDASDARRDIQDALDEAAELGTASDPCTVVIPEGEYTIDNCLFIQSNTTLSMEGVTITESESHAMLRLGADGDDIAQAEGYCYQNISLEGGTWDRAGGSVTAIYLCHGSDISLSGVTVTNCDDGHLVEVAAVDGITFEDCSFSDQTLDVGADDTYEAIQLDIMQNSHVQLYAEEDLPIKDLVVTGCSFQDVVRGVGNHATVLNSPIEGVTITDNSFEGIASCAIQLENVEDCTISGNLIEDAPRGIFVFSYCQSDTYLASALWDDYDSSTSYATPSDADIEITDNEIALSGTDDYTGYQLCGIYAAGMNLSSSVSSTSRGTLKAGNYYLTGVNIEGNEVSSTGYGIRLSDVRSSTVLANELTCTATSSAKSASKYSGISVTDASKNDKVSSVDGVGNTVKNFYRGIVVDDDSTVSSIYKNTVSGSSDHGIFLYDGAEAETISTNTVTGAGGSGVMLSGDCEAERIYKNTITSPGVNGVYVYNDSSVDYLKNNAISSAGNHAIYVSSSSDGGRIQYNEISKPSGDGIMLSGSSEATNIYQNTISSPADYGIRLYNSCSVTTVSTNTISSPGNNGIMLSKKATATNLYKNTIKSAGKNGIQLYNSSTATNIKNNTISSPEKYGIQISDSSKCSKIYTNTISSATKGISVTSLKCNLTIYNNTIKSCAGHSIYLNPGTKSYTISVKSNAITGKGKAYVGVYATKAKVKLYSNTIKNCKYPSNFTSSVKGYIYKNTVSGNKNNKYLINSKTCSNVGAPTLSVSAKSKSSITLKWSKKSYSGYQLYRSTSKSGDYSKVKTITPASTTKYKNTGLSKNKAYYYKVRAYKSISNTTIYGSWSDVTGAKTKSS